MYSKQFDAAADNNQGKLLNTIPAYSRYRRVTVLQVIEAVQQRVENVFKTGISHFCMQHPDVETLVLRIVDVGGEQTMAPADIYPGEKPYMMAFTKDLFGNMIEILSHCCLSPLIARKIL